MPLHTRIGIALVLGVAAGVAVNLLTGGSAATQNFVRLVTEPAGRIWLNALIMVVIPLVVSTLAVGVAGLGNLKELGRIGALTIGMFLLLTLLAAAMGVLAAHLVQPGAGLPPETTARLMETYRGQAGAMRASENTFGIDMFVGMVPRNPLKSAVDGDMLAVIFFALMLGIGLTHVRREFAEPLLRVLESLAHVTIAIIEIVMTFAPIGVFCLIFSVMARFGFGILFSLVTYVLTVVGGLFVFAIVVYPIVLAVLARRSPIDFFRKTRVVILTAFSTSSSSATLPMALRVAEQDLRIAPQIAGFVVPLGSTMNQNGTALFEAVAALFIARVFGIALSLPMQAVVIVMAVITAGGTAGVPGGSIPLLMIVLATVGVPVEGIAIVIGVDRILDMCRTSLNVTGDLVTACVVERFEGARLVKDAVGGAVKDSGSVLR